MSWSVGGAWAGFLVGAVLGGVFDVLTRSGQGVLVAGHAAAAVGALAAATRARRTEAPDSSSAA